MKNEELAKAAQVIRQANVERSQKCFAEIQEILKKYNCTMEPEFIFRGMKVIRNVLILPIQDEGGGIENNGSDPS